jgi:hypothetical protein
MQVRFLPGVSATNREMVAITTAMIVAQATTQAPRP